MNTTLLNAVETSKSTKDCETYNKDNEEAISLGLIAPQKPTQQILEQEKKDLAAVELRQAIFITSKSFWKLVISLLPPDEQTYFNGEKSNQHLGLNEAALPAIRIQCEVEQFRAFSNYSYRGPSYYRVTIGNYGDKNIYKFKIQDPYKFDTDMETAKKVAAKISERVKNELTAIKHRSIATTCRQRSDAFHKENKEMLQSLGIYSGYELPCGSEDNGKFTGKITFTGTKEQWQALHALVQSTKVNEK